MTRKTPFKIQLGQRIKSLRKQNKLTQDELASKLGINQSAVANYESGYSQPENAQMKKIANILGVSVDYLLGDTSIINPKLYLEETLSKYDLTEYEYNTILSDILENNTINLSILNSDDTNMKKIKKAYCEIFNVYVNYLENNPLDTTVGDEKIKSYIKTIDAKFITMLKSINKDKIVYKNDINVFPTIDIPKKYPVLGKISAGLPILAVEDIEDYSYAPSSKIQEDYDYFFLKVQGDSMNKEFPDGCLLLVQRQPTLEKGQIGVFRINGDDATVKRFQEENGFILLEPRSTNPIHKTQTYDPKKVKIEIIGKVISYIGDVN